MKTDAEKVQDAQRKLRAARAALVEGLTLIEAMERDGAIRLPFNGYRETLGKMRKAVA